MANIEYTPNLDLAKQPTGAREWGAVLNENFEKIDAKAGNIQGSYNVGDIFYSMRTEQEFNGAAVCDGEIYNISDFSGASTIGELLTAGKLPYVSMTEYATSLTANGSVRCFGWDGGETFRVPTLNDVFIQAGQAATPAEFLVESLPNIKGNFYGGLGAYTNYGTGAFYEDKSATAVTDQIGGNGNVTKNRFGFDASRSSSTYKDDAKVRPDSVRYRAFVQLASKVRDVSLQDYSSQLQETTDELNADIRLTGAETKNFIEESIEKAEKISDKVVFGNIGDIKYTARTEEPNGCVWCNGRQFAKADLETVYQMLVDGKLQAVTMDVYDSTVSTNGSCGFFGLDTENQVFKVPTLTDVYIKSGQAAQTFGAESLPNITGEFRNYGWNVSLVVDTEASGALYRSGTPRGILTSVSGSSGSTYKDGFSIDASRVSSAYQDGAKVNPDHVKYRACVVLFFTEKEMSIVNWTNEINNLTVECTSQINDTADTRTSQLTGLADSRESQLNNLAEELKEELVNYGAITISYEE